MLSFAVCITFRQAGNTTNKVLWKMEQNIATTSDKYFRVWIFYRATFSSVK